MDNSSGLTANLYLLLVFQGLRSFIVFLIETVAGFFLRPDRSRVIFLHRSPASDPSLDLLFQAPLSYSREGNKRLISPVWGARQKQRNPSHRLCNSPAAQLREPLSSSDIYSTPDTSWESLKLL